MLQCPAGLFDFRLELRITLRASPICEPYKPLFLNVAVVTTYGASIDYLEAIGDKCLKIGVLFACLMDNIPPCTLFEGRR
jgi:hypothetical protein